MASPRITNAMREGIVTNTIDHQFKTERDTLRAREIILAAKANAEAFTKAELDAFKTIAHMLSAVSQISTNCNGKKILLSYDTPLLILRGHHSHYGSAFVPSAKLATEIEKWADDSSELNKRIAQAKVQLEAMLSSVQTFKKLRAVWPQGEKFYDMYDVDSETKSGVPAVVITDLNKILGIK